MGPLEADADSPDGPKIMPVPSSGVSKEVRCKCEAVMMRRRQGRGFPPPTVYDLLKFQLFSFWSVL